ncbi:hypothetical protein HZH68_016724 [Vespula germanica]|uniref:Uncharacterized protein n=1 Tax=Vespula germanica TaxID=30212 RepID=A0A834IZX9_VESGE|nr:hypothetical protein HZH68_016724 [Vespula germanica]
MGRKEKQSSFRPPFSKNDQANRRLGAAAAAAAAVVAAVIVVTVTVAVAIAVAVAAVSVISHKHDGFQSTHCRVFIVERKTLLTVSFEYVTHVGGRRKLLRCLEEEVQVEGDEDNDEEDEDEDEDDEDDARLLTLASFTPLLFLFIHPCLLASLPS